MYNDLFSIGPITVHGYGLMIAIGIVMALVLAIVRSKSHRMSRDHAINILIICLIFGFLGAKLLYCIVEWEMFVQNPLSALSGGGFVVYGGIITGMISTMINCHIKKISFLKYFDLMIPCVSIAQGFGRVGCFLAGCCYGAPTDGPLAVIFPEGSSAPAGVPLIPTQLISSAGMFLITLVLILYAKRDRRAGRVGALYMILYSAGRFVIEFFRSDYRGEVGIFSTSQFISLFIAAIGIYLWLRPIPWLDREAPEVQEQQS